MGIVTIIKLHFIELQHTKDKEESRRHTQYPVDRLALIYIPYSTKR